MKTRPSGLTFIANSHSFEIYEPLKSQKADIVTKFMSSNEFSFPSTRLTYKIFIDYKISINFFLPQRKNKIKQLRRSFFYDTVCELTFFTFIVAALQ